MNTIIEKIIHEETFTGEDGKLYLKRIKEISTPCKIYLKGKISGKYRGSKLFTQDTLHNTSLYDFEIYEAEVNCKSKDNFRKGKPFSVKSKAIFPREKLPQTIPVIIRAADKSFAINILEPKLFDFETIRKLHQTIGDDVFGSFTANVTGYIINYEKNTIEEVLEVTEKEIIADGVPVKTIPPVSTGIKTGGIVEKGPYRRYEELDTNGQSVWSNWKYPGHNMRASGADGCMSTTFGVIGIILGLAFLLIMLPGLGYFIPLVLFIFLLHVIGPFLRWVFRIIGVLILLAFFVSLFTSINSRGTNRQEPVLANDTEETKSEVIPITDTIHNTTKDTVNYIIKDTVVTRHRVWRDYDNTVYEGTYEIKLSAVKEAHNFKKTLNMPQNSIRIYDKIISLLKTNDKNKLNGIYKLFDSITAVNKLSEIKFAEMLVSFVQDIPYTIILESGCDAKLYNDTFTRQFLSQPNARCSGFQRFGINTPIEFLYSLNGDCDTRTLLLYTLLSHYNYDVALLSSEYYSHSMLGINLPINGASYHYNNTRYVLWETTAPDIRPGIISNEMSNMNNWRISLKSK